MQVNNVGTAAEVRQVDEATVEFPNVLVLKGVHSVAYFNVTTTEGEVLVRRLSLTPRAMGDSERMFALLEALGLLDSADYIVHDRREDLGTFDVIDTNTDKIVMNLLRAA